MNFANRALRAYMAEARLFQWEVAEELGISEPTFTRWLRRELSAEREELVRDAIKRLLQTRGRKNG